MADDLSEPMDLDEYIASFVAKNDELPPHTSSRSTDNIKHGRHGFRWWSMSGYLGCR